MTRKLILASVAVFALSTGAALAQQNNSSADDSSPSGPNCASNATAGCPQEPEDLSTQSGPGTTGADSQPAPGADDVTTPNQNQQGQPDGDLGGQSTDGDAGGTTQ